MDLKLSTNTKEQFTKYFILSKNNKKDLTNNKENNINKLKIYKIEQEENSDDDQFDHLEIPEFIYSPNSGCGGFFSSQQTKVRRDNEIKYCE
jgi:hypothetical protein